MVCHARPVVVLRWWAPALFGGATPPMGASLGGTGASLFPPRPYGAHHGLDLVEHRRTHWPRQVEVTRPPAWTPSPGGAPVRHQPPPAKPGHRACRTLHRRPTAGAVVGE